MERIKILFLLGAMFVFCFFATTAALDWVCQHTGYYEQAAQESVVLN